MHEELRFQRRGGKVSPRLSPALAVRLLAITALLLAVSIVLALALEAQEPGPPPPGIRPLPQNFFHP
jgi:hypothetical protein